MAQYFYSAAGGELEAQLVKLSGPSGYPDLDTVTEGTEPALSFPPAGNDWASWKLAEVPSVSDFEILLLIKSAILGGSSPLNGPAVLLPDGLSGFAAAMHQSSGFRLDRYDNKARSYLGGPYSAGGSKNNEDPYKYLRYRRSGATHTVTVWDFGSAEPSPQLTTTDATYPTGVFVGLWANSAGYLRMMSVGTDGDPAPTGPVAPGGNETNLTLAPIQQDTQAEVVAAAQVSAVDAVILSQSANSEIASVSQIATASGVESQQISQAQQAGLALSALLGSVEAQQLTSAEALDVSIVQPDALTVAVVEQLLQAEPVSASQSALLEAVIGQSRTQALAVQVAADYTLAVVTAEQLAQVEALEILDGTGLQVVTVEQSTSSDTASVTLLALVDGTAVEQGTNANLVVTAATLVITASQAEQLTEAEIADIVGSAMFLDPRELTVSRTTTGFTVRRTTPTYTMQFKHSVH